MHLREDDSLPVEILLYILSFLPPEEFKKIDIWIVSKSFSQLLQNEYLWKHFYIQWFGEEKPVTDSYSPRLFFESEKKLILEAKLALSNIIATLNSENSYDDENFTFCGFAFVIKNEKLLCDFNYDIQELEIATVLRPDIPLPLNYIGYLETLIKGISPTYLAKALYQMIQENNNYLLLRGAGSSYSLLDIFTLIYNKENKPILEMLLDRCIPSHPELIMYSHASHSTFRYDNNDSCAGTYGIPIWAVPFTVWYHGNQSWQILKVFIEKGANIDTVIGLNIVNDDNDPDKIFSRPFYTLPKLILNCPETNTKKLIDVLNHLEPDNLEVIKMAYQHTNIQKDWDIFIKKLVYILFKSNLSSEIKYEKYFNVLDIIYPDPNSIHRPHLQKILSTIPINITHSDEPAPKRRCL